MYKIGYILFICFLFGCSMNTSQLILPNNDKIIYSGRIDFTDTLAPTFSYSGASVRFAVKADSIHVTLNDSKGMNFMAIIIDDVYMGKLQTLPGENKYLIANNLEAGIHQIELIKITEEMFGKISIKEILVHGELVRVQNPRKYLIEFIGNSITCGYGNEGKLGETFGASTENHYMTYAAFTARSLNAQPLVVCKSGIGIYRNYDGPITGNTDCMPNYYDRIHLYDSLPLYNFSSKPDLICINLGTNDFSTTGPDTALFVNSYLNFIQHIQEKYDNPEIICLLGPMLEQEALDKARNCIKYVVSASANSNKGKVHFFEMSGQQGNLGIGIDYHPTVEQHLANSRELVNFISTLKGWEVTPKLVMAKHLTPNKIMVLASQPVDFENGQLILVNDGEECEVLSIISDELNLRYEIIYEDEDLEQKEIWIKYIAKNGSTISQCKAL